MNINTIKKTVILKAGEKFTLPPDSKLLSTTGILTSTGCPVPTPENFSCYGLNFSIENGTINGQTPAMSQLFLTGFRLNSIDYLFTTPIDANNGMENIPLDINCSQTSSLAGLITFVCSDGACKRFDSWGATSSYSSTFKMLPSFGNDAYLIGYYPAQVGHSARIDILFKVKPIADIERACPCS